MKIEWKSILGTVAPVLATALGGPLAGVAVKALASGLGVESEGDVAKLVASGDATTLTKLREIDLAFETKMAELGIDMERVAAADRDSARQREVSTGDHWTPRALAAAIVVGYFVVQWYVLSHIVAAEQREIVMRSMGVLDTALGLVLGYYFGSSSSSRQKTDALVRTK